jgi:hypothetical protein
MKQQLVFGLSNVDPEAGELVGSAKIHLAAAMRVLLDEGHHPITLLNALITVYVDLGVKVVGIDRIEASVRLLHEQMPRIKAVLAAQNGAAGHA